VAVLAPQAGWSEAEFLRRLKHLIWFSLLGLLVIAALELAGAVREPLERMSLWLSICIVLASNWAMLARAERHARAESERTHPTEALEAVRLRDETLSVAAHELKNPAATVRGYAQLLERQLERTGNLDPGTARRALKAIDSQSSRLDRLLSHLLDISRIQSGKLRLTPTPTDLARLVTDAVEAARVVHQDTHTVALRAPASVPVVLDPLRIEQVVTNLLDNALKYSPQGGEIEVELTCPTPDVVRLTVRDHGIGIPSQDLERIFDRLYQVETTSQIPGRIGLGLGLHICRQIVELHGGRIVAEAPSDGGTRMLVELPTSSADR
jgi:signal transduction histidine kinase